MDMDTYLTIKEISKGEYKEKGSKFIALTFNVYSENDIKRALENTKKEFYDARHHCYAYILGINDNVQTRANDDGEPKHSAGTPILNQIKSNNLTNILVIVVRYFGGTKLGVSGLINAYKSAVQDAIENAEIVEEIIKVKICFSFQYPEMNDIMKIIKNHDLEISYQDFQLECKMCLMVRESLLQEVMGGLEKIESVVF